MSRGPDHSVFLNKSQAEPALTGTKPSSAIADGIPRRAARLAWISQGCSIIIRPIFNALEWPDDDVQGQLLMWSDFLSAECRTQGRFPLPLQDVPEATRGRLRQLRKRSQRGADLSVWGKSADFVQLVCKRREKVL